MSAVKIFLVDDHEMLRAGLKSLIENEAGFKVVGQAGDGEAMLVKLKNTKCDCVVMDLSMPNMDGITALKAVRQKYPKIKVLVLTMQRDEEHLKHAMSNGAKGYVLKDDAYEQLVLALKTILLDKIFISPKLSNLLAERYLRSFDDQTDDPSLEILTRREKEILKWVASGMANKNVAAKLKISVRTVETHRSHLIHKLGIKNTAGLVKYALNKGLI
jgi:two-component system response regulator NreC